MAVIKKTLFPKNLDRYSVLVNDADPNSRYFKITELPDTFTGGKNAFLIAGSEELLGDTKIQIELKDGAGNIIYHEPGEGYISSSLNGVPFVTEYFEGISKVVSVYIYPDTSYGPCTLTILGELSKYENNGLIVPIPIDWEGKYNVKWQKQINVNPALANTTKIRFYQRPTAAIKEILSPIYRIENDVKVNSGVSQSFADIKLSKLETFAGDVKRIKVFRTSQGDISDYDLIQDILVESKELLTSYGLTGSVVGQTGIITSETLKSFWNTGSLNAYLTSSRVESGVALNGSGYFRYTSSLDIKSSNTYELNLDAFYSSSTPSNLGIYLGSGSMSSSIGTLYGISPTKNLLDTVIPFKISSDYPSASLYFSQSQGEWHLGNISLKLSQDTAFSPDEISFITTMPSVIGNETYNFKFEFYDVNNNYVPIAVTQSLTFTGGVNVNNTLLLVSASASQSLAALAAVSSSISGTMTVYSSSASSSVNILSGSVSGTIGSVSASVSGTIGSVSSSVSGTIGRVSGSISGSIYSLSGSVSSSLNLTSGSINLVSSSLLFTSQSLSSSLTTLSSSLSSSFSAAASQSAYQVYSASQYLDKFIFTDVNGKLNQPPTASDPGLYLGSEYLGYYNGTGTSGWKTYMDNQGDFYLTSSVVGGGFLAWDSSTATLQIQGAINIQGGNAATTTALSSSLNAVSGAINSATSSLSTSVATTTFTTATGLIAKPPTVLVGSTSGLYLGSTNLGYYNGSDWKTYMANNGNFYLSGPGSDSLTWAGGVLTINGAINITGGNVQSSLSNINATTSSLNSATSSLNSSVSNINSSITNINSATSSLDSRIFTNSSGLVNKTPSASTSGLYLGSTFLGYYNGSAWKTYMDNAGKFYLSGTGTNGLSWDGSSLSITGVIKVSDGTEVTNATITGAASGATALQNNATGKSLGLTGGSVGGVTIASNKIYVGTGTWGNSNTGFYVDNTGQMSLKDKLTWDGTTLSITGNIVITGGSTKTAIDDAAAAASSAASAASTAQGTANSAASAASTAQTTADGKLSPGSAASDVNNNTTTISGGKIRTGKIQSNNISGTDDGSDFSTAGTSIDLTGGGISAKNFRITAGGDAFFKGSITGASGTFGGSVSIGSGNSIFKADGSGIYLGNATFAAAPFRVTPSGALTATNASLSGVVTATGGAIGGWTINGSQLNGSGSAGQIVLDPNQPSIKFLNQAGSTKLTFRTGLLSSLYGGSIGFNINAFSIPGFNVYTGYNQYDGYGSTSTVYVGTVGNYVGNINTIAGFTNAYAGETSYDFEGDLSIYIYADVTDSTSQYVGRFYLGGASNYYYNGSFASYGVNFNQSIFFPTTGYYTITPSYNVYYNVSRGNIDFYGLSTSTLNITFNPELDFGEVTEYGLQVASSADQYVRVQRGSSYAMEAKGAMNIEAGTGNYIYLKGTVHPSIGNTYDLATTGNRWRSIWSNNALNSASDRNLKNSIQDTDLGLSFINKLRPVKYKQNWSTTPRYHYGLIAQEVTASLQEFGKTTSDVGFIASSSFSYTDADIEKWKTKDDWPIKESEISASIRGEMGLSYTELMSPMIKAIQELSEKIIYLESKLSGSI